MNQDKLNELKKLAKKLIDKNEKWIFEEEVWERMGGGPIKNYAITLNSGQIDCDDNEDAAHYIAAANPVTIFELIVEIERLEKSVTWHRKW